MRKILFAAAAATAFISTAALAAVTYDPDTGGFVGKGDVQSAFGWNNGLFQQRSEEVYFTYEDEVTYTAICFWQTGQATHTKTVIVSSGVNATMAYHQRQQNQLLGWDLDPISGGTSSDPIPVEGESCDAEGQNNQGTYISVDEDSTGDAGLYAHYGNQSVLLQ